MDFGWPNPVRPYPPQDVFIAMCRLKRPASRRKCCKLRTGRHMGGRVVPVQKFVAHCIEPQTGPVFCSSQIIRTLWFPAGSAGCTPYATNKGIVLNEPSVVATIRIDGQETPYAFGSRAKMMLGRTPNSIQAKRPLKDGVIADFKAAEEMLKYFINAVHKNKLFANPTIVICVPSGSTPVQVFSSRTTVALAAHLLR